MVNKEAWLSSAIVVVLLVLGVFLTQKTSWFESSYNYSDFNDPDFIGFPPENVAECQSDSDCIKVETNCCPCTSGGEEKCIPKSLEKSYIDKLETCKATDVFCAQVYNCKINSCSCVNGRCEGN